MRNYDREHKDTTSRKYAYDFDAIVRKYLLRTFAPYLAPKGNSLELGCYRGDMTEMILRHISTLTVVEAAPELAKLVGERFPGSVVVINTTIEAADLAPVFDNIFLIHTLEHIDDPVSALARIRQWLAPRGRFFVAVPNANALSRQIAVKMGLVAYNAAVTPAEAEHGHRRTYSIDVLLNDLKRAQYRVVGHGGVLVKPLANFQFDSAIEAGIVNEAYLEACNELARTYPDLAASVYAVCEANG